MKSQAFRPLSPAAIPPWEGMVIVLLLCQPSLIEDSVEALASLDFVGYGLSDMRNAMLNYAQDGVGAGAGLRGELAEAGFTASLDRIDQTGAGLAWFSRREASLGDASILLKQVLATHQKARLLPKEIQAAALDLAADMSDANLARIRDLHEQRNAKEGLEATLEGFGGFATRSACL